MFLIQKISFESLICKQMFLANDILLFKYNVETWENQFSARNIFKMIILTKVKTKKLYSEIKQDVVRT